TIVIIVDHVGSNLQRESCFPDAARSHQRQESVLRKRSFDLRELTISSDEGGKLWRKIIWRRLQCAQCWKALSKPRVDELIDSFRRREIAQAHGTQVAQRDIRGQPIFDQRRDGL